MERFLSFSLLTKSNMPADLSKVVIAEAYYVDGKLASREDAKAGKAKKYVIGVKGHLEHRDLINGEFVTLSPAGIAEFEAIRKRNGADFPINSSKPAAFNPEPVYGPTVAKTIEPSDFPDLTPVEENSSSDTRIRELEEKVRQYETDILTHPEYLKLAARAKGLVDEANTFKGLLSEIYRKLGAKDTADAIAIIDGLYEESVVIGLETRLSQAETAASSAQEDASKKAEEIKILRNNYNSAVEEATQEYNSLLEGERAKFTAENDELKRVNDQYTDIIRRALAYKTDIEERVLPALRSKIATLDESRAKAKDVLSQPVERTL